MRRVIITTLAICALTVLGSTAAADVIVRGPFGGLIVVSSPVDVRVGPGVFVGVPPRQATLPTAPVVVQAPFTQVIVSKPAPVVRVDGTEPPLPLPQTVTGSYPPGATVEAAPQPAAVTPLTPQDFAKTFKPTANASNYEVVFLHPLSRKAVPVTFNLPAGNPRVTYLPNLLLFDYGQGQQVEIRFLAAGRVQVTSRQ